MTPVIAPGSPLLTIGGKPDHGFDAPLGLLSDCHRRTEHVLTVLTSVADARTGGPLSSMDRDGLHAALAYFATAAPTHTADEEESLFPRLRRSADAAAQEALAVIDRLERDHGITDEHHATRSGDEQRWLSPDDLAAVGREMAARRAATPTRGR